jgi:NADPH:quinone reductase-like Zn-dependent oxidoreductase
MRAVVRGGPNEVAVQDVPAARVEEPTDLLVTITATNICGSDLHMYEGRTSLETGRVLGHQNPGEVIEAGSASATLNGLIDAVRFTGHIGSTSTTGRCGGSSRVDRPSRALMSNHCSTLQDLSGGPSHSRRQSPGAREPRTQRPHERRTT